MENTALRRGLESLTMTGKSWFFSHRYQVKVPVGMLGFVFTGGECVRWRNATRKAWAKIGSAMRAWPSAADPAIHLRDSA